jgi:hypothetical protein
MAFLRRAARRWWRSVAASLVLTGLLVPAAAGLICPCPAPSVSETHGCCPETDSVLAARECCARAARADVPPPVPSAPSAPALALAALGLTVSPVPVAVRDAPAAPGAADSFFANSPPLILRV